MKCLMGNAFRNSVKLTFILHSHTTSKVMFYGEYQGFRIERVKTSQGQFLFLSSSNNLWLLNNILMSLI